MATRRERVILDLEDNYTQGVARAAVATSLLNKELHNLDDTSVKAGRGLDRSVASTDRVSKSSRRAASDVDSLGSSSRQTAREIDKLSGRLRLFTDAALIIGPALAPLGAGAVGGLVALSAQLGATAGALGVTVLATKGLGDGLKALDTYQLEPTAENFVKLQQEMKKVGPAGEEFIRFLDSIEPNLKSLQTAAREGLLPGAEEGIKSLLERLPELRKIIRTISEETGSLFAGAGKGLAGPGFDAFFEYLRTDGVKILDDTGKAVGNLAETVANLFAAFGGTSMNFSSGLLDFTRGLSEASANLDTNAGFQKFLTYIETEGPHAMETLGSIANAVLQIVEATAPLGGPVLTAVGKFADAIAKIADSDIGTPIFAGLAALALLNRSMAITASLQSATFGGPAVARMKGYVVGLGEVTTAQQRAQMSATELDAANATASKGFGKFALPIGGLVASMTGVGDATGYANTAMLAVAGPWGAAAGFALDLWHATDPLKDSIAGLNAAMAAGDLNALTAQLATARAELKGIQDDQQNKSNTEAFLGGFAGLTDLESGLGFLTGKTGDLKDKVAEAADEAKRLEAAHAAEAAGIPSLTAPLAGLRVGMEKAAEAAAKQDAAIAGAIQSMHDMREEALRAVNAELNYQASIDDATAAVKENGKTHDKTTEAGRANLQALYNLAGAWNGQSEVIKGNSKLLQAARDNFIKVAGTMGIAAGDARKLSRELFDIPEARQTKISTPGMDEATSKAKTLKQILDQLKSKDINIALHYQTLGNKPKAPIPGVPSADGGTVPKTGKGYADRHLYMLADGEEVISNRHGQADRHRSLLKAINAGRKMADGGTAGPNAMWDPGGSGHGGIGPNSQLYGLGSAWLSMSELADRISHLTLKQLKTLGDDIDSVSKKNLPALAKALDAAATAAQKQYDHAKQMYDDAVARRDSISSSIQQGLMGGDIWSASSGSGWAAGSHGANDPASALAALNERKARAQRLVAAINTLKQKGVTGPALLEIIGSGDVERAEAMASLDVGSLSSFSTALNDTNNALAAAGLAGGNAIEGDNIREWRRQSASELKELREIKQAIHQVNEDNKKAQKDNAKDVKDGINGAASHGPRRGR
jgi:hypothetical protein